MEIHQALAILRQGLGGKIMQSRVGCYVRCRKTAQFHAPFCLVRIAWPKATHAQRVLAALANVGRAKCIPASAAAILFGQEPVERLKIKTGFPMIAGG